MTIEIHRPELEALIHERMASGRFASVEDALLQALQTSSADPAEPSRPRTLVEVCAMVRGLTDDVDFSRNHSLNRPVDFS